MTNDDVIYKLTDGAYDRATMTESIAKAKDLLVTLFLEQERTPDEQKEMRLAFSELNYIQSFLK